MNPLRLWRNRGAARVLSPELEAAARAKRARDHLARKRERERGRLERERQRHELGAERRATLRVLSIVCFVGAMAIGAKFATPIASGLWLDAQPVEAVAVQGGHALSSSYIAASAIGQSAALGADAGAFVGVPIAALDADRVRENLEAEPWIKSARALRLPTGTLVVRVVEKDAVARWQVEGMLELVDERGVRFPGALAAGGALPLVQGAPEANGALPGDALEILREVARHNALASDPSALTLYLPGLVPDENILDGQGGLRGSPSGYVLEVGLAGPRALLGRRQFAQRIARLASLLDEHQETVRAAGLIDLRYADRAVLGAEPVSG